MQEDILTDVFCEKLTVEKILNVEKWKENLVIPQSQQATYAALEVQKMKQPTGSNYCWVVSAAVIVNKLQESSWDYLQIANMFQYANQE